MGGALSCIRPLLDFVEPPSYIGTNATAPLSMLMEDPSVKEYIKGSQLEKHYEEALKIVNQREKAEIIRKNISSLERAITTLQTKADEFGRLARDNAKKNRRVAEQQFRNRKLMQQRIQAFENQKAILDAALLSMETSEVAKTFQESMNLCRTYLEETKVKGGVRAINDNLDEFAVSVNDLNEMNAAFTQTPGVTSQFTDQEIEAEFEEFLREEVEEDIAPGISLPDVPSSPLSSIVPSQPATKTRQREPRYSIPQ